MDYGRWTLLTLNGRHPGYVAEGESLQTNESIRFETQSKSSLCLKGNLIITCQQITIRLCRNLSVKTQIAFIPYQAITAFKQLSSQDDSKP